MPDTTLPTMTATGATPVVIKPKRQRHAINQAHARALTRAENVTNAALLTANATPLALREISSTFTITLQADIESAGDTIAAAIANTAARKAATVAEKQNAHLLIAGLREVQKAAKQKYQRTNRKKLDGYLVGKPLNGSRANLMLSSKTIIDNVNADTVPGITPAKITALKTARQNWVDSYGEQIAQASAAMTSRAEAKSLLQSIEDRRLAIQLAADAQWPYTDEANVGIRREFSLPSRRPFST